MSRNKLIVVLAGCWIVAAILGGIVNLLSANSNSNSRDAQTLIQYEAPDTTTWKQVMSNIEKFNPEPKQKPGVSQENAVEPQKRQLTDAILIGTVLTEQQRAILLLPGDTEPVVLSLGEQWLAPWSLTQIEQGRVVWQNDDTNQQQQQVLFQ
ncbi:hypothetical protein [Alteromonas gilva]|uniref:Type II secretion system protein GspC N-terminal domain-containing protein n=1 Tax=Alteromonas gilva TaxID=2987522 RepID=A0ABT5L8Z0_9ALTE|nr:hypothetical protein [Alteromonas gilva]MDC8833001.1 hypothetical protein [Alteromonas gilva]